MTTTLGTDTVPAIVDYPEGTLLLETRMRWGKIWQPSEEDIEVLERDWKLVRDAKVRFIVSDYGTVNPHVTREKRSFWQRLLPSNRSIAFRLWFCWLTMCCCTRACCCDLCRGFHCECCSNVCNK